MKPLGKTRASPPTGSDLSALPFERGDCRLYQDALAGYDASSSPQRGEKAASAVPSILKEGKGGKLVKTPTRPCCKQRNLFCNAAALPGSHAHHRARPAGAEPRQPGWATLSCPIPSHPIPSRPITQRHGGSVGALGQRLPLPRRHLWPRREERWLLRDSRIRSQPRSVPASQAATKRGISRTF